ncbi:DUF1294 domain-containing protein [Tabrizicola sp. J26]|uniref:DUF1294 domain-containing protein n=1 Tax=Alitabrizicola rongguiensis TaxID=2909234 RepID=UPI001F1F62A3|nr:DUF1294 domain-containing protein [Tabrizicola rongguiensis]MCF1708311.1 DUF1294 domain-containing protein [Tabrizicola rongguiensis]
MTQDLDQYLPAVGDERMFVLGLVAYLLLANGLTLLAFWLDSRRTAQGLAPMPSRTLLILAVMGGWPAGLFARVVFRHGGRGRAFALGLNGIAAVQVLGLAALSLPVDRITEQVMALKSQALAAAVGEEEQNEPDRVLPRRFGPGSDAAPSVKIGG